MEGNQSPLTDKGVNMTEYRFSFRQLLPQASRNSRPWLLIAALATLGGCVAKDNSSASSDVSILSEGFVSSIPQVTASSSGDVAISSGVSVSSSSLDPVALGKAIYEAQCALCHGANAEGGAVIQEVKVEEILTQNYTADYLSHSIIGPTMPMGNPGRCEETCAENVTAYLGALKGGFGAGGLLGIPSEPNNFDVHVAPVVIRSLNDAEYDATVRDLFNTQKTFVHTFPEQTENKQGYATIGAQMSVNAARMEAYEAAADVLIRDAMGALSASELHHFEAESDPVIHVARGSLRAGGYWAQLILGNMLVPFSVEESGIYEIRIRAGREGPGPDPHVIFNVDNLSRGEAFVPAPVDNMGVYTVRTELTGGPHELSLFYDNDVYVPAMDGMPAQDLNIVYDWIQIEGPLNKYSLRKAKGEQLSPSGGSMVNGAWNMNVPGVFTFPFTADTEGLYRFSVRAGQDAAGDENAKMRVMAGERELSVVDVGASADALKTYVIDAQLGEGRQDIRLNFTNDLFLGEGQDRNLIVDWISVEGPISGEIQPRSAQLTCGVDAQNTDCARELLAQFAPRAWRRTLSDGELEGLIGIFDEGINAGGNFDYSLYYALRAVMLSENFTFRPELVSSDTAMPLNGFELASRLSYFLWSSMPDAELFALAESGSLQQGDVLRAQVQRMLVDPKSAALIDNFASQWLRFDGILGDAGKKNLPAPDLIPGFDDALAQAMAEETRLFLQHVLDNNLPLSTLIDADYSFANTQLADFYGVSVAGGDFQRVSSDEFRRGLLGHASILTLTSAPKNTSPPGRGAYVLKTFLCSEPKAPPGNFGTIADLPDVQGTTTRDRFLLHRQKPECANCHILMDPIGFGLENLDFAGRWRDIDNGAPVDSRGELPTGETFEGAGQLADLLKDSYRLPMCFMENILTYGLGRPIHALGEPEDADDYPLIYELYRNTEGSQHAIRDVIEEIVLSRAFRETRVQHSVEGM